MSQTILDRLAKWFRGALLCLPVLFLTPAHAFNWQCEQGEYPFYKYRPLVTQTEYDTEQEAINVYEDWYFNQAHTDWTHVSSAGAMMDSDGASELWEWQITYIDHNQEQKTGHLYYEKKQYCSTEPPPEECPDAGTIGPQQYFLAGFDTTPNPANRSPSAISVPFPTLTSIEGCGYNVSMVISPEGYSQCHTLSQSGPTGYYEIRCLANTVSTGQELPPVPEPPPPPCQGSLGTVNGDTKCLPLSPQDPRSQPDPEAPGDTLEESHTPQTNGGGRDGSSEPEPPNGQPRQSGAGSSGGDQGGGTGTTGSGAGNIGEYPKPCGIPGSAPCKIDETGTGNGDGVYEDSEGAMDLAAADREGLLGSVAGDLKITETEFDWNPLSWLPTASCNSQAFVLTVRGKTMVDASGICDSAATQAFRSLLGWFYIMLAILYVAKRAFNSYS